MKIPILIIISIYFIGINTHSYVKMREDKILAENKAWRTPEKELMFLAAIGGAVGVEMAMYDFPTGDKKHKIKKAAWRFGIPSLFLNHAFILFLLFRRIYKTKTSFFVARNQNNGKLLYFKIGNVRQAKYIMEDLPEDILVKNEFYIVASKEEKPWDKI